MSTTAKSSTRLFFSIPETAVQLGSTHWFVRYEIARGELIAHRFGGRFKISAADLAAYIKARRGAGVVRRRPAAKAKRAGAKEVRS